MLCSTFPLRRSAPVPFVEACKAYQNLVPLPHSWRAEVLRLLVGQDIEVSEFLQILRVDDVGVHMFNAKSYLWDKDLPEEDLAAKVESLTAFGFIKRMEALKLIARLMSV